MDIQGFANYISHAAPDEVLGLFWGGTVLRYSFDIEEHTFDMDVEVRRSGIRSLHRVILRGVSRWSFNDESFHRQGWSKEPWDYVSLTSITPERVDVTGTTLWRIVMELWSAVLEVQCLKLTVETLDVSQMA